MFPPVGCAWFCSPNEVAAAVCATERFLATWLALTSPIELFQHNHYRKSIREDADLFRSSPGPTSLFTGRRNPKHAIPLCLQLKPGSRAEEAGGAVRPLLCVLA